jgi:hypothetical protein
MRPGSAPKRVLKFRVRVKQRKIVEFDRLGDNQTPGTALHYFHQHGRKGTIAALWDEK